jgi:hypothetical protein
MKYGCKNMLDHKLDKLISILSATMPEDELSNGWTSKAWRAMQKSFEDLKSRLEAGKLTRKDLSLNYPRGLDSWGVFRGCVYDRVTELNIALHEYLKSI